MCRSRVRGWCSLFQKGPGWGGAEAHRPCTLGQPLGVAAPQAQAETGLALTHLLGRSRTPRSRGQAGCGERREAPHGDPAQGILGSD